MKVVAWTGLGPLGYHLSRQMTKLEQEQLCVHGGLGGEL